MASNAQSTGAEENPRNSTYDPFSTPSGSLPLLVKLPDGERHQVDIPPKSSVRDLKAQIASLSSSLPPPTNNDSQNLGWDLDFAGSVLNENHTLEHYNIPDAYDHANGLLKTISDSGYDDPDKKVEALDKAYVVVKGISRGERDMERLVNSVFDDANDMDGLESPTAQPSLTAMRRSKRSRIPSLNFSSLPPIGDPLPSKGLKSGLPSAPPTPSQLIRRLSNFRPDLYDPKVVDKATAPFNSPSPAVGSTSKASAAQTSVPQQSPKKFGTTDIESETLKIDTLSAPRGSANTRATTSDQNPIAGNAENQESGELKRENTWFTEVFSSLGTSLHDDPNKADSEDEDEDVDGDSEGDELADRDDERENASSDRSGSEIGPNTTGHNGNVGALSTASGDSERTLGTTSSGIAIGQRAAALDVGRCVTNSQGGGRDRINVNSVDNEAKQSGRIEGSVASPIDPVVKSVKSQGQVIGLEPEISLSVPSEQVKIPKKRGRKRKNPHLSEEERKAQRQKQNRESAKLSRIRRKNMTMEYEKRVNTLEGENENLRDTVAALTGRLEMLQNLLTVSVQKRTMPTGAIEQLATAHQGASAASERTVGGLSSQAHVDLNRGMNMNIGQSMGMSNLNMASGLNPTGSLPGTLEISSRGNGSHSLLPGGQSLPSSSGPMPNLDFNNL